MTTGLLFVAQIDPSAAIAAASKVDSGWKFLSLIVSLAFLGYLVSAEVSRRKAPPPESRRRNPDGRTCQECIAPAIAELHEIMRDVRAHRELESAVESERYSSEERWRAEVMNLLREIWNSV